MVVERMWKTQLLNDMEKREINKDFGSFYLNKRNGIGFWEKYVEIGVSAGRRWIFRNAEVRTRRNKLLKQGRLN